MLHSISGDAVMSMSKVLTEHQDWKRRECLAWRRNRWACRWGPPRR